MADIGDYIFLSFILLYRFDHEITVICNFAHLRPQLMDKSLCEIFIKNKLKIEWFWFLWLNIPESICGYDST